MSVEAAPDLPSESLSQSSPKPLRVTPVQTDLHWHDPAANRAKLQAMLAPLQGQTDLIVLPEMFTSGFTGEPESFDNGNTQTIDWLLAQAKALQAAITGSVAFAVDGNDKTKPPFVNRLLFATPEGDLHYYDKVHLFRMGDEHKRYQSGEQRVVIPYKGWRLLLTVCYDLRFPAFCRTRQDYDVMVCVANWPSARRHHWRTLLQARAIENQVYVVGVNRIGTDGRGWHYSGDSLVVDFLGENVIDQPDEWVATAAFDYNALEAYRQRFPVWKDADTLSLELNTTADACKAQNM